MAEAVPVRIRAPLLVTLAGAAVFAVSGVVAAARRPPGWEHDVVRWALHLSDWLELPLRVAMQFGTEAVAVAVALLVLVVTRSVARSLTVLLATTAARYAADVAKALWDRPRPARVFADLAPRAFDAGNGFPSGHATAAAALAVVLAAGLGRRWWPLLGALALLTAAARVYLGVHFVVDVAGGLALGAAVGGIAVAVERASVGWRR